METKTSLTKGGIYITVSQVVLLVTTYIMQFLLGSYLGPELYGIYGVISALITTVTLFLIAGLPLAISKYIAENPEMAYTIKIKALKIQSIFSIIIFATYFFSAGLIADLFNDPSLKPYIQLSAFVIPTRGISSVYSGFFNGLYQFRKQAIAQTIYAVARLLFVVLLTVLFSIKGAIIGLFIAPMCSWLYSSIASRIKIKKEFLFSVIELIKFIIPITIFSVLLTLLMNLDLFLVKSFLASNELTGYYNAAAVISKLPYMFFGTIATVIFPAISNSVKTNTTEKSKRLVTQAIRHLLILLVPCVLLVSATSKQILSLVYTKDFSPGAEALSILIIGLGFLTLFYLMSNMITASGKPFVPTTTLSILIFVDYILNKTLIGKFQLVGAALATTITTIIAVVILSVFVYKGFKTILPVASLLKILLSGFIVYVIALNISLSKYLLPVEYAVLFLFYLGILHITKELKREDYKRFRAMLPFRFFSK